MSLKAAILVDEMNAMKQLESLNILGIRQWSLFFKAIENVLQQNYGEVTCDFHFYGAIPPIEVDQEKHFKRSVYYKTLKKSGINIHRGFCQRNAGVLVEKGVDVLLALDLVDLSRDSHDILFVFSGDADLVPAVQRAKLNSKVSAIITDNFQANYIRSNVDSVIPLEVVISLLDKTVIIPLTNSSVLE